MATSKVRRLGLERERSLAVSREEAASLRARIRSLEAELAEERDRRISAQRGLVAYMREHGLGDRIGYDPDQDEAVWAHEHPDQPRPARFRWQDRLVRIRNLLAR